MLRIALTFLSIAALLRADDTPPEKEQFSARQLGNNIELMTPYGPRLLWGDEGLNGTTNYRLEIPIEELKSKEQKAAEEKRRREDEKNRAIASQPQGTSETKIIEKEKEIIKETNSNTQTERERELAKEKMLGQDGDGVPGHLPKKVTVEYDETDRFVLEANRLYNRGKFYEASLVVEELLRRKPDFVRGWVMKGSLLHVQGYKDRAKVAWETALRLDPNNEDLKKVILNYR